MGRDGRMGGRLGGRRANTRSEGGQAMRTCVSRTDCPASLPRRSAPARAARAPTGPSLHPHDKGAAREAAPPPSPRGTGWWGNRRPGNGAPRRKTNAPRRRCARRRPTWTHAKRAPPLAAPTDRAAPRSPKALCRRLEQGSGEVGGGGENGEACEVMMIWSNRRPLCRETYAVGAQSHHTRATQSLLTDRSAKNYEIGLKLKT